MPKFPRLRRVAASGVVGFAALSVSVDGAAGADTTAADAAAAVETSVRSGDDARLAELARQDDPDPWLVADQLCGRGASEAAVRYAHAAATRPDTEALPGFVASRRASPPPAAVAELLERAAKDHRADELITSFEAARSDASPFDRVRLSLACAADLRRTRPSAASAAAALDAADVAARIGWFAAESEALRLAARDQVDVVDFTGARSSRTRLLAVERRRGRIDLAALRCMDLGSDAAKLGDYRTAVARYEEALAIRTEPGPQEDLRAARVLSNLAVVLGLRGDYARAIACCDDGLSRLPKPAPAADRIKLHSASGDTYLRMGDTDRAQDSYRAALAAAVSADDGLRIATSRASIALVQKERGDLSGAKQTLEEALEAVARAGGRRSLLLRLEAILVDVCAQAGDPDAAKRHGERALSIADELKDDNVAANVMHDLSTACRAAGELGAAESWTSKSLEIAERLDSRRLLADDWEEAAANALARKDVARAVDASRRAIAQVVRLTSGLAEGQGAQARGRFARLFRLANSASIRSGDAATVFEFAENGRAVEFLASLEQGEAIREATVPAVLREAEEAARVAESDAAARFAAARAARDLATIRLRQADLDAARAQHEDAINRMRRDARGAAAIFPRSIPDSEVRAALGIDDALVIYVLGDEVAAALVLTSKEMRLVPLGETKALAAACAAWDPKGDAAKADAAITALTKALVEPLRLSMETRRVLVSPDGDVYRAPLAAIFSGREAVHVLSASSYVILAAEKALRGTKVLAVGAPDYSGRNLAALPESGPEATDIGDVVVTGAAATEAGVRAEIAKVPHWLSVHFAVHGIVNEKRPMLCGLALTAASPDDGVLTALEVLQHAVPSDLVVLSACDSGGGRVFAGEGLVGMPRAFLFAGAPRVIASSWKVDDAATRALMTKFYELWRRKGLRASAALAGAQDAVRADERWRHPRFWAAWTLWGVGD